MKKWLKHLRKEKGMTLVELLAVVVILGIIAAIAVPAIGNIIENSKNDAHVSNALLIINAAKLAETTGNSDVTTKIKSANGIKLSELVTAKALDSIPANPSDNDKAYDGTSSVVVKDGNNKYSIKLFKSGTTTGPIVDASESQLNGADTGGVVPR